MYDAKCYDLACDFVDDFTTHRSISRAREKQLRHLVAQAIQTIIEDTLNGFDPSPDVPDEDDFRKKGN